MKSLNLYILIFSLLVILGYLYYPLDLWTYKKRMIVILNLNKSDTELVLKEYDVSEEEYGYKVSLSVQAKTNLCLPTDSIDPYDSFIHSKDLVLYLGPPHLNHFFLTTSKIHRYIPYDWQYDCITEGDIVKREFVVQKNQLENLRGYAVSNQNGSKLNNLNIFIPYIVGNSASRLDFEENENVSNFEIIVPL